MTNLMQTKLNSNEINPVEQTNASTKLSAKYKFQSSEHLIELLASKGFSLSGTSYSKPRNKEKLGFQKHLMLFDNDNFIVDDTNKLQLLVTNSHCGDSSVKFNLGIYRTVCANGLVVGDDLFNTRVPHIGNDFDRKIYDSIHLFMENYKQVVLNMSTMKNRELTKDEYYQLIKVCTLETLKNVDNVNSIDVNSFLPVRKDDYSKDLYTIFNRIQERVIKGGIKYTTSNIVNDELSIKRNTTRKIKSIDRNIELNKFCWNESMKLVA